jgi:hypothetical protein
MLKEDRSFRLRKLLLLTTEPIFGFFQNHSVNFRYKKFTLIRYISYDFESTKQFPLLSSKPVYFTSSDTASHSFLDIPLPYLLNLLTNNSYRNPDMKTGRIQTIL